jgi:bacterioferritin
MDGIYDVRFRKSFGMNHVSDAPWARGARPAGSRRIRSAESKGTRPYRSPPIMPTAEKAASTSRQQLIDALNEDLAREYQAIIAYVVYSQTLKGAAYMAIAAELEKHASEELQHALTVSKHIDYLGGTPTSKALPIKETDDAVQMLRADLDNENATIRNYRARVSQCEKLGEYAIAEDIREILRQEQEHQSDLATALGEDVPDVSK